MSKRVDVGDGEGRGFVVCVDSGGDEAVTRVERAPARRDDCDERLRVYVGARELPMSPLAVIAAAALREGHRSTFELGVTALTALRGDDGRVTVPLPAPVLGPREIEARAAVAASLGLREGDLDPELPITAGSCGTSSLLVPAALHAVGDASFSPDAFRAVIEKARVLGALVFGLDGDVIVARWLALDTPPLADPGATMATACAAVLLARAGRLPIAVVTAEHGDAFGSSSDTQPVAIHGAAPAGDVSTVYRARARHWTPAGRSARVEVTVRGAGRRDGDVAVSALARVG